MDKEGKRLILLEKNIKVKNSKKNLLAGFTLIEVLITVIIIGILASIALPGFNKSIESSRAELAKTEIRQIYTAEKMYHLAYPGQPYNLYINNTAPNGLFQLGYLPTDPTVSTSAEGQYFDYTISGVSSTSFTATATRKSDSSKYHQIDQDGNLTSTGY